MIKPPFNYTGNKNKLIKLFNDSLFPRNLNNVLDLFGGGATVTANINAKNITYNDINGWVPSIMEMLKTTELPVVLEKIKTIIDKFELSSSHFYPNAKYEPNLKTYNTKGFYKLRDYINSLETGDNKYLHIFVLSFFSFNNDIRKNGKGLINIPCGKSNFNSNSFKNLTAFSERLRNSDINITTKDFNDIDFTEYDFIYADPPYIISTAVYNAGWKEDLERQLLDKLLAYSKTGGKFAISNLLESKGKSHTILKEWVELNGFNIVDIEYTYKTAYYNRTNKGKDREVLITNYKGERNG